MRQGHDVTLFASGDLRTSAKLVRCCEMALPLDPSVRDGLPYHMIMLDDVRRRIDQFDVLARPRAVRWGLSRTASCLDLHDSAPSSTVHPQYSAAAAPGFRCERTFSKWH